MRRARIGCGQLTGQGERDGRRRHAFLARQSADDLRGFAKLILTSKKGTPVHFDLHGYNRVEWTGSENLKKQLRPIVDEFARSFGLLLEPR
jgi:hypothetical protein